MADDRLRNYTQAMVIDPSTGKSMPKVFVVTDDNIQPTLKYIEHRILSTDNQPVASTSGKGATLIHIDTGDLFMSDGTSWVVWE